MINKQFYTRLAMLVAGTILFPVLFCYLLNMPNMLNASGSYRYSENGGDMLEVSLAAAIFPICTFCLFISVVLMGYAFHNLRTRQGRIAELTLPATNLERFLAHILIVTVGNFLLLQGSVLLADLVNFILAWLIHGQTTSFSITESFYNMVVVKSSIDGSWISMINQLERYTFGYLMFLSFYATYLLGNVWKYRYNIVLTTIGHILLWLVIIILFSFIVSWNPFYDIVRILAGSRAWLPRIILVLCAFFLFGGLVRGAYRMYCKAEYTTRRNP